MRAAAGYRSLTQDLNPGCAEFTAKRFETVAQEHVGFTAKRLWIIAQGFSPGFFGPEQAPSRVAPEWFSFGVLSRFAGAIVYVNGAVYVRATNSATTFRAVLLHD